MNIKKEIDINNLDLVSLMNQQLENLENNILLNGPLSSLPVLFIVGNQRSGSTLLSQILIRRYNVAYINNLIARFWQAPIVGTALFKSLPIIEQNDKFVSNLGYTDGVSGPHEFGFFWKRFFPVNRLDGRVESNKFQELKSEVSGIQTLFNLPLLFKNIIFCSFQIKTLSRIFPNSLFLYSSRNIIDTAISTYEARFKLHGNYEEWFGLYPDNYNEIKNLPPIPQVMKQCSRAKEEIESQLDELPKDKYIEINYESLIQDTELSLMKLDDYLLGNKINKKNDDIPTLLDVKKRNDHLYNKFKESL